MDKLTIRIRNWEKYQGKSKHFSSTQWLRIQNTIIQHDLWRYLSHCEIRIFLYLLCRISLFKNSEGEMEFRPALSAKDCFCTEHEFFTCIAKLEELEIISTKNSNNSNIAVRARSAHGPRTERYET